MKHDGRNTIYKTLSVVTLSLILSSTAHATLFSVNLGGGTNNAVYDDVLDITWLANANLAASNTFGVSDINASGSMNWNTAESYMAAMNATNTGAGYLGVNTWRQSTVSPVNGSSFNTTFTFDGSTDSGYQLNAPVDATYNQSGQSAGSTSSELAYHYYNNLGAIGACSGVGNSNTYGCVSSSISGVDNATNTANLALFDNLQNSVYWTGTELAPSSSDAFEFNTTNGFQVTLNKNLNLLVWAVAPGNVAAVPVPAAVWLMGSALAGLFGFQRKRVGQKAA